MLDSLTWCITCPPGDVCGVDISLRFNEQLAFAEIVQQGRAVQVWHPIHVAAARFTCNPVTHYPVTRVGVASEFFFRQ